ncbi:DUF6571 family protein [Streptomyces sp. KL118A]|uniref:DUF6571 family protein n=1 Tax=Streptomyces sp. KL118A TaxID=3045153 RepID=UPI00278C12D3|nr:DUF6571 family protein [Streptomyces sp. KL118A]
MPNFQDIYDAPLSKMKSAIDDWRKMTGDLVELHTSAKSGMRARALDADWTGNNSDITKTFIKKTASEFNDAALEAKGIADILNEGYLAFKAAKEELRDIVDTEAPQKHLTVDSKGKVTAKDPLENDTSTTRNDPDYKGAVQKQNADIADMQKRINRIVEECSHTDEWTARVLKSNATRDKHDFSKPRHSTIDAAEVARAAELAKVVSGEGGTARHPKELKELAELTHANKNDPEFSTAFYRKLGPEGSLEFYAKMSLDATSLGTAGQDRVTLVHGIQNDMGSMLGTATRTHGTGQLDAAWTTQLMRAGRQQIDVPGAGAAGKVYGYQALGSLLRDGKYDTTFLTSISRDMAAMDKKDPGIWDQDIPSNLDVALNHDKDGGRGFNPLTGMMEAMSHNPEAATKFFNEPVREDSNHDGIVTLKDKGVDGDHGNPLGMVDYFLDKGPTDDWFDTRGSGSSETNPFQNSLGNALETSVTHRPPGDLDAPQVKHTEEMTNIMERVVEKVGEDPSLVAGKSKDEPGSLQGLAQNFGDMSAEYMPDLQASAENGEGLIKPFGHPAEFAKDKMAGFLGAVAQDPHAYGAISNAQQAYTTTLVHDVLANPDRHEDMGESVRNAVHPGGEIAGMMTEARAQAVHDAQTYADGDYNKGVEENAKWANRFITAAGAKYVELIPIGGDVVGWVQEDISASVTEGAKRDTTDEARRESASGYAAAERVTKESARNAVAAAARGIDIDPDLVRTYQGSASTETATAHSIGRDLVASSEPNRSQ